MNVYWMIFSVSLTFLWYLFSIRCCQRWEQLSRDETVVKDLTTNPNGVITERNHRGKEQFPLFQKLQHGKFDHRLFDYWTTFPTFIHDSSLLQIQFMLLFSRQGKCRLQKWYGSRPEKFKKKITRELIANILTRKAKMSSFLEWQDLKIVYKR